MDKIRNQVTRQVSDSLLAYVNLSRVYNEIDDQIARTLKRYMLTTAQFQVLSQLWVNPEGLTQNQITAKLQWTKGNTSGVLGRMIDKDYVSRESVPEDRRFHRVILTHKGRNLADKVTPRIETMITNRFDDILSVRERRMLKEIMTKTMQSI